MEYFKVYQIVNSEDTEIYVGCTKSDLNSRWSRHKSAMKLHPDRKFYRYMREIGADNFRIELLEVKKCNKLQAQELEQKYIDQLNPMLNTIDVINKIYQCEECDYQSRNKSHLTKHIRIHTGERPFGCEYCNKRFSEKSTLTGHIRIHTGERPFGCEECDKRFNRKRSLTRHIRTHTGEQPFKCICCHVGFTREDGVTKHNKTKKHKRNAKVIEASLFFSQLN